MPILRPDAFRFAPKGRWQWLQRTAWRLLRKLGALEKVYEDCVKVERRLIDADTFMERIFRQQDSLFREFNKDARRLVIGAEDYAELMREAAASQHFSFKAEIGYGREIMGLTVDVIPWIRGMVVLP